MDTTLKSKGISPSEMFAQVAKSFENAKRRPGKPVQAPKRKSTGEGQGPAFKQRSLHAQQMEEYSKRALEDGSAKWKLPPYAIPSHYNCDMKTGRAKPGYSIYEQSLYEIENFSSDEEEDKKTEKVAVSKPEQGRAPKRKAMPVQPRQDVTPKRQVNVVKNKLAHALPCSSKANKSKPCVGISVNSSSSSDEEIVNKLAHATPSSSKTSELKRGFSIDIPSPNEEDAEARKIAMTNRKLMMNKTEVERKPRPGPEFSHKPMTAQKMDDSESSKENVVQADKPMTAQHLLAQADTSSRSNEDDPNNFFPKGHGDFYHDDGSMDIVDSSDGEEDAENQKVALTNDVLSTLRKKKLDYRTKRKVKEGGYLQKLRALRGKEAAEAQSFVSCKTEVQKQHRIEVVKKLVFCGHLIINFVFLDKPDDEIGHWFVTRLDFRYAVKLQSRYIVIFERDLPEMEMCPGHTLHFVGMLLKSDFTPKTK